MNQIIETISYGPYLMDYIEERFHVSVIRIGPAAGARKLCDIDKGVFGVTKSLVRNFESSCMTDQNYEVILLD